MFSGHELEAQAASAAFHSSVIVALPPPSLPVFNCPFLIFSASSIPEIVTTAWSNRFNPSIGRIRCFTLRWSCSRLFKYWLDPIAPTGAAYSDNRQACHHVNQRSQDVHGGNKYTNSR